MYKWIHGLYLFNNINIDMGAKNIANRNLVINILYYYWFIYLFEHGYKYTISLLVYLFKHGYKYTILLLVYL